MVAIGNEPDSPGVEGLNDGGASGATEAVNVKPAVSAAKWWSMVRVVIEGDVGQISVRTLKQEREKRR